MVLYTKSIKAKIETSDGMRICIMRKQDVDAKYDLWMPELSPSPELREKIKAGLGWDNFFIEFEHELDNNLEAIRKLITLSKEKEVTILCVEDNPERCHRSLVAKRCRKVSPDLEIVIK